MALVAVGHILFFALSIAIDARSGGSDVFLTLFCFLALTQLVYVIPLVVWMHSLRNDRAAKGVWIAAGITALLNAACFGVVVSSLGGW
jgi:hypothetical protein